MGSTLPCAPWAPGWVRHPVSASVRGGTDGSAPDGRGVGCPCQPLWSPGRSPAGASGPAPDIRFLTRGLLVLRLAGCRQQQRLFLRGDTVAGRSGSSPHRWPLRTVVRMAGKGPMLSIAADAGAAGGGGARAEGCPSPPVGVPWPRACLSGAAVGQCSL